MIDLTTRGTALGIDRRLVGKVTRNADQDRQWPTRVLVTDAAPDSLPPDLHAVVCRPTLSPECAQRLGVPLVHGAKISHLNQGDVVSIDPSGSVRTVYRRGSPNNTLFATERCNSLCVMCSQPPRDVDDYWRVQEMEQTVSLMDPDTREVGISGGEPTLLGDGLLSVIRRCRDTLPTTTLHILSNGRLFRYGSLARAVADIGHHDLMWGIPVYSDLDYEHDHVVQARGAFEDTILGLHNLARFQVPVEIRVVIHEMTYRRLNALVEFIYRNLTFADHVALMGLEATGFAKGNMQALWIDPWEYRDALTHATLYLAERGMRVSVYNHQLCTVDSAIWPYCRQSISDWKNEYLPACESCNVKHDCGGFFAFNLPSHISTHIAPVIALPMRATAVSAPSP